MKRMNQRFLWYDKNQFIKILSTKQDEVKILEKNNVFKNIAKVYWEYFLYKKNRNKVFVINISNSIENQKFLVLISFVFIIIFSILSYIISIFFVKSSLNNLNFLLNFAKTRNIDNLHQKLIMDLPDWDEIKILSNILNDSFERLNNQASDLKDFISNVSHELKTPLMLLNSEIDYILKSRDVSWLEKLKKHIYTMNSLFEQLVLITKIENDLNFIQKKENISDLVLRLVISYKEKYKNMELSRNIEIDKNCKVFCNLQSAEIIFQNLIDNACKYSKKWWKIKIELNLKFFYIKDFGVWIDKKNLWKIFDKFYKEDLARTEKYSFWLWLYLTKKLVDMQKWTIKIDSKKWEWSEFFIYFK